MGNDLMKRSMGLLASTLLAAGLGVGGTAVAAGPAAADTGLKTVTISAESFQSYTNNDRGRDRDRDHNWKNHKKWCETHGYWKKERHGNHYHWKWVSYCDDDHKRGRH
jgi:shikimate 5-dehydrogenase